MRHLKRKVAAVRGKLESQGLSSIKEEEQEEERLKLEENIKAEEQTAKQEEVRLKKEEGLKIRDLLKEEEKFPPQNKTNSRKKKTDQDLLSDPSWDDRNQIRKTFKESPKSKTEKGSTSAKNIIKNYGRALQNFAISNMVLPYISPLLEKEKVALKDFRRFFYSKKKQVRSIAGLRNLLLVSEGDDPQTAAFKRIFQEISIVFIKYFSVNWIFGGKLLNKIAHLKCRFKMLRRIKNPENFTYLKGFL